MNVACLVRRGFSIDNLPDLSLCKKVLSYKLGEPFSAVWQKAAESGVEYLLLLDEAVHFRSNDIQLLIKILESGSKTDGITLNCEALTSVYGFVPQEKTNGIMPWTAEQIKTLPSWFALLRLERWTEKKTSWLTPEYFLLSQSEDKHLLKTHMPRLSLNSNEWASDLIAHEPEMLSADYLRMSAFGKEEIIPPQFKVKISGAQNLKKTSSNASRNPTFSILCPSIRPDFLREAVQSVIRQSWQHWELRIGVDGPKEDNLRQMRILLKEFQEKDERIHVHYQKERRGTGPTRQKLLELSRGDYVLPLDDDDQLPDNALEIFADAIIQNPDVPVFRGGTRLFGLFESYLSPRPRYVINGIINDIFEVNQPWVVKRDTLHSLGGLEWDPELKNAGEDSDLFLKIDRQNLPVILIDKPLYERRLSTFNQTLDCTAEECYKHIHFLYAKHQPPGWKLEQAYFKNEPPMLAMTTVHRNQQEQSEVVGRTRFMNFQQVGNRDGVVIDLEVTSLCNAVCTFCPREHLDRNTKFISLEAVRDLAESIKNEREPLVVLCGIGESTLHPDLEQIVSILSQVGARVCLTTNGSRLQTELVNSLVEAGLSELNISLNAATAETHAALMQLTNYEQIVSMCRQILKGCEHDWTSLKVHVSFVLVEQNIAEVEDFVEMWRDSGVSKIWIHPLTNRTGLLASKCKGADYKNLEDLYSGDSIVQLDLFPVKESPTNLCRIANGIDFISVDGDMLLCAQDYLARHRFGNIKYINLGQLHQQKLLLHLRGETADTCASCTFCPPSFKTGKKGIKSIVQAGGLSNAVE